MVLILEVRQNKCESLALVYLTPYSQFRFNLSHVGKTNAQLLGLLQEWSNLNTQRLFPPLYKIQYSLHC